jgi:hypothetical protein
LIPIANLTRLDNDPRGVLLQIDGVSYKFRPGTTHSTQRRFVGYIAQQIESVVPSAVQLIDGILHVDYESLIPYLSESIKQNFNDIKNNKRETQKIHEMVDQLFADFTELKEKHTNSVSDSRTHAPLPYRMRWYKLLIGISVAALLIVSIAIGALVLYEEHKNDNIDNPPTTPDGSYSPPIWKALQALHALFNSTDGPYWLNNTGWMTNDDFCSWYGITCENGTVTKIDLSNNGLQGTIPRNFSLALKDSLSHLDLSSNFIYGTIPEDIVRLDKASKIILRNNGLGGVMPTIASPNFPVLNTLDLSNNRIRGTIPSILLDMSSLQYLNLSYNSFDGTIPNMERMPPTVIDFSWNFLQGSVPVISSISLSSVNFSHNKLTGEIQSHAFRIVQKLNLRSNSLTGAFELHSMDHFTELDISNNKFVAFRFAFWVPNSTELFQCNASNNPFKCPLPSWAEENCSAQCTY